MAAVEECKTPALRVDYVDYVQIPVEKADYTLFTPNQEALVL